MIVGSEHYKRCFRWLRDRLQDALEGRTGFPVFICPYEREEVEQFVQISTGRKEDLGGPDQMRDAYKALSDRLGDCIAGAEIPAWVGYMGAGPLGSAMRLFQAGEPIGKSPEVLEAIRRIEAEGACPTFSECGKAECEGIVRCRI